MSLSSALQAGVSGLTANSSALTAISNDIANSGTVGYKGSNVDFESMVAASDGGGFSSGGVSAYNQQLVTTQGTSIQTSSSTDLAISGQGLFVTTPTATAAGAASQVLFTRSGSFTPDANGFLKNSAGLYLQGVLADANGVIPTTGINVGSLKPINVDNIGGTVSPTTMAGLTGTLNADQAVSAAASTYNASTASTSMTAYNATSGTGVKPDFTMQVPVSDSQGGQHIIQVNYLKTSTPNQWDVEIQTVPTSDLAAPSAGGVQGQIAAGTVTFGTNGALVSTTPSGLTTLSNINWAPSFGVASQSIALNLGATNGQGGLTQVAGSSAVSATTANGTPFGSLSSVSINNDGIVTATFTNGVSRAIAEIPLATFPNADGLTEVNGTAYEASNASGLVSFQTAGSAGAGQIASNTLEASTVDLSSEFTNLITTQQAYTASSKVITTADQMTQVLLQLIQ